MGLKTNFGAVGIGPLLLSVLLQQFFSIAGDSSRAPVSALWVQPILMRTFPNAYFLTCDPIFKFDWRNTTATFPVNLQVGKAFNQNLTASLGPEYNVAGPSTGNWLVKATVNYLNW